MAHNLRTTISLPCAEAFNDVCSRAWELDAFVRPGNGDTKIDLMLTTENESAVRIAIGEIVTKYRDANVSDAEIGGTPPDQL